MQKARDKGHQVKLDTKPLVKDCKLTHKRLAPCRHLIIVEDLFEAACEEIGLDLAGLVLRNQVCTTQSDTSTD